MAAAEIESEYIYNALKKYSITTLRHCLRVEYYCERLLLPVYDPLERPHDINGERNRLEPFVAKRLCFAFRDDFEENKQRYLPIIRGGITAHRRQWHHKILESRYACKEMFGISLVDAICAQRENRIYQKNKKWEEITFQRLDLIKEGKRFIEFMKNIPEPNVEQVDSFIDFTNIGITEKCFEKVQRRCKQALLDFNREFGLSPF